MLDQFTIGRVQRISPEAPVPVVEHIGDEVRLGGAANVAHNIRALGATPRLIGLVGADDAAATLRAALGTAGIAADGLIEDRGRPTTRKVRIVTTRHQQVARVDYESDADAERRRRARPDRRRRSRRRGRRGRRRLRLPEGRGDAGPDAAAGRAPRRDRPRRARRSEDPAPRLVRRRVADHAEPPRSGSGDAHAHPHRRRRPRRGAGVPRARRRDVGDDHPRRARPVAGRRRRAAPPAPRRTRRRSSSRRTSPPRPARSPTSPAPATP